jgi:glycerol-3-phosphate cytidylyltransferase
MKDFEIGITFGSWDLLHPGHITFLQTCSLDCETLIVGLHVDPRRENKNKAPMVETVFERWVRLNALRLESELEIVPYSLEEDIVNMLAMMSPDVYFIGGDYKDKLETITGYDMCVKKDITISVIERSHNLSTTRLKQAVVDWMDWAK